MKTAVVILVVSLLYFIQGQNNQAGTGGTGAGTGAGTGESYSSTGDSGPNTGQAGTAAGTVGTVGTIDSDNLVLTNLLEKCFVEIEKYGYCNMPADSRYGVPISSVVFSDCFVRSAVNFSTSCKIAYDAYRNDYLYRIPDTGENVKYTCMKDLSQYCPELLSANWTSGPNGINETCLKQNYYHFDSQCQFILAKWLYNPILTLLVVSLIVLGGCFCCCCCVCLCCCLVRQISKKKCTRNCRLRRYQPLELPNDRVELVSKHEGSPEEQDMTEMATFVRSSDNPIYLVPPQQYQYAMIVPPKSVDGNTAIEV